MIEFTFDKRRYHEHRDMATWCNENFGDGCWGKLDDPDYPTRYGITRTGQERWGYNWGSFGDFGFQFRNEEDAMLFSLRWL